MISTHLPEGNWHHINELKIPPPRSEELSLINRFFLQVTKRKANTDKELNVFGALSRLGKIFPRYLLFLSHILMQGKISRTDKTRIILRTSWRLGCIYEWGHHSKFAADLGITAEETASIAQPLSDDWDARLAVLIAATDDLILDRRVSDDNWKNLATVFDENQLVEFCMLVGHYIMVAGMINSVGVEIESGYITDYPSKYQGAVE